jgi:biotin carboxylase
LSKILILGAGKAQAAFIQHALSKGHDIYLVDGNSSVFSNGITHLNLHTKTIDITNSDEVLAYATTIIPDAVIAPSNDAGLISATIVASHFRIPGPGLFAAQNSRNKFKFRKLLQSKGLTSPWFLMTDLSSIHHLGDEIPGYPCVIKPVQGSGSKGVRFLSSASDLNKYVEEAVNDPTASEYQVEEFIEGVEFSVEGIVQNGELQILAICEKKRSELPFLVDTRVTFPPRLAVGDLELAQNATQKIVNMLRVENAPVHLEFIQSPSRGFVAVECAVRAAGFNLFSRMVPWCTGIDTLEAQLNLVLGSPMGNIEPIRQYAGILEFPQPSHEGHLRAINYTKWNGIDSSVEIEIYKELGEMVAPSRNGAERVGHIFIFSKTQAQAVEILNSLHFSIDIEKSASEKIRTEMDQESNHA